MPSLATVATVVKHLRERDKHAVIAKALLSSIAFNQTVLHLGKAERAQLKPQATTATCGVVHEGSLGHRDKAALAAGKSAAKHACLIT